ncbi:MAG: TfoX/Sxy family protein [Candidatus Levybacteria bacterium]|nr:TfoX/Sxy family protein [Candidatus Levybacteria bacterium]
MKNNYLDKITKLLERTHPKLASAYHLEFKNCFGAIAGYIDGHIFIACGKFGIALRLPREVLDDIFKEKDVKHLKYFAKGHIKKDYAVLPERILENKPEFQKLVDKSIQLVNA